MIKKKIPMRKCTGCQEMKSKKELIRIVRNDEGEFFLDSTGKKSGRGAYICFNIECLEKVCKNKGLERSFKSSVPQDIYQELKVQFNQVKIDE